MRVNYHRLAREELYRAVDWYDARQVGLGDDLYADVEAALAVMRTFPDAQPSINARLRKIALSTFPYNLIYMRSGSDVLTIVAVAHMKRRPGYWQRRLARP
jgi:toxin ParE1/3/4